MAPAAPAGPPASAPSTASSSSSARSSSSALPVRVGRVLGQLLAGGRHGVVLGALAAAHDLRHRLADVDLGELEVAAVEAVAVAALELAAARHARVQHTGEVDGRRHAHRAAADSLGRAGQPPRREQRDADGAHRAGVGRHDDLALQHRGERARQRRVGGRLALEEDPVQQPPLAHHPAAVVAHHRVLQAGEDVVAAEAVAERLGGDVGHEDRAGLAEVGRSVAVARPAARTPRCRPRRGRSPAPRGTSRCRRCRRGSCRRRRRARSRR